MKSKDKTETRDKPHYPKTKDEVLNSVKSVSESHRMFIRFKNLNGYSVPKVEVFGLAIRKAVEIFCSELSDLNPEFAGYFLVLDGCLCPAITKPEKIAIKQNFDTNQTMYLPVVNQAAAYVWCSALNKSSRYWEISKDIEKSQLCFEMMKDFVLEFKVYYPLELIAYLDGWEDILNKLKLQPNKKG